MNRRELAEQALNESNDPKNAVRPGKRGYAPFWNMNCIKFMYVPAFHFTGIRDCGRYRYDAVDENNVKHSFESSSCEALLTPVWPEIPEGVVRLTVTAINPDGSDYGVIGARIFFKSASFPEKTPEAACDYKTCAKKAYEYTMKQPFVLHWLREGTPDPYYDLNTYPSKIVSSLVNAMIYYSKINPDVKNDAMKVAKSAADWLISITKRGDTPLANLPPTYYLDFCPDAEKYGIMTANYRNALAYNGTMMMIYPASAGRMYLNMAKATGDKKYEKEALLIGKYYLEHVEKNGSWFLVRSEKTGEPAASNYIAPMENVVPFLMDLYEYTGEKCWKDLSDGAVRYTEEKQLSNFNWEGQFEDVGTTSSEYDNLTQYGPVALAEYYLKYYRDDPEHMETAKELMRYAEDQFVLWNRAFPWFRPSETNLEVGDDFPKWNTPAGMEQFRCYAPIDASTSHLIRGFLAFYEAGFGELYLAKARVLADQITRAQHENGKIPTFWENTEDAENNFWFNCLFFSCETLVKMSEYENYEFE